MSAAPRILIALAGWAAIAAPLSPAAWSAEALPALSGQELFERKWVAHDERSSAGDGLGPLHNATSCVACHHQKGTGGGGGNEHNVDLLSLLPQNKLSLAQHEQFVAQLGRLHPGFIDKKLGVRANLVLHRFGAEADYYTLRARLLGIEEPRPDEDPARRAVVAAALAKRKAKGKSFAETLPHGAVTFVRTQRHTPALWGAGLIDSIPGTVLQELVKTQAKEFPEVSGRPAIASGGGVGHFGWRGQTESLAQFVLAACANELGLQTSEFSQATSPLAPHYQPKETDLSASDVAALVAFIVELPKPVVREPRTDVDRQMLKKGREAFDRAGCQACHVENVGRVEGLFSDLLLHAMGPELDDPVEPHPATRRVAHSVDFGGYAGGGLVFVDEEVRSPDLANEWRTPPLWGVADSAPYLHDGRAGTLAEAIALHGGEAALSAQRFRDLAPEERTALVFFLQSLVAPPIPPARR